MEITIKDFMLKQPNYPDVAETDKYYIILATRLAKIWDNARILMNIGEDVRKEVVLAIVGYFQDIISDAGIWRSFSTMCYKLYNRPLPIYERPDDYIDSELNYVDLQFISWYVIESHQDVHGLISPYDNNIARLAHLFFNLLDAVYEEAPTPVEYNVAMDVDLADEDCAKQVYDLSYWLFWNCYFFSLASTGTLNAAMAKAKEIIGSSRDEDEARQRLVEMNRQIMIENPTGPLSFTIGEWVKLIVEGKEPVMDDNDADVADGNEHKFYKQLVNATGGSPIAFIDSYDSLERFVSEKMGWGKSETGHLPGMKKFNNFVLLGNRAKGMLIAHDVAQYINHPDNAIYDADAAREGAHRMVTERGVAPIDLVKYLFKNDLLPDARLPFDKGEKSVLHDNWDFFARLFLQSHYRGD